MKEPLYKNHLFIGFLTNTVGAYFAFKTRVDYYGVLILLAAYVAWELRQKYFLGGTNTLKEQIVDIFYGIVTCIITFPVMKSILT